MVLGPGAVVGDPLQVDPLVGGQAPAALGELLLSEQARLDALGQLDLLLGVEQRDLADLLQVVLDRVRGRARHGHLGGRQVIVVVAEDQDLLVLAAAVRGQLDHPGARRAGTLSPGIRLRRWQTRLRLVRLVGVLGPVRPVDIDGPPGDIADVVGEDGQDSERGLEAGIIGVQIAKVIEINILQIRTGIEVRLVEVHGDQAALGVGAQPRIVFIRVRGTRTVWPPSRVNRLILDGPGPLARGPGALLLALCHLPAVTLRAAPGFAFPGITPAHPHRLPDHPAAASRSQLRARQSPGLGCLGCLHNDGGSGKAEPAGPGIHAGPAPFVVYLRVATSRDRPVLLLTMNTLI